MKQLDTPRKRRSILADWQLYLMFLPAAILLIIFAYAPMYGLVLAFKDFNPMKGVMGSEWVGLEHFRTIVEDEYFYKVLGNTVWLNILNLIFGFPIPIILAILLNEVKNKVFKRTIQTLSYLPHFISWVIVAGILINILSIEDGIVNEIIKLFGGDPINFFGNPEGVLNIEKDAFEKIIQGYTRESGVRNLEREIATICRKVAYKLLTKQSVEPVTAENVAGYLGAEKYKDDAVNKANAVGSATGLAWTRVGGCTLTIDATLFSGKGEILLTGKLGDVMKESARTAISLVRSLAEEYNIDPTRFEKTDIHIHIPEGAIPKDGPSAGITMATVIMSAFANIPVDANVAMTGEITLRGKVLAIGGLKEKVMAAYRQGIKKVIIPKDNEKDLEDIPQEIASDMQFVLAEDIQTVYKHALVK